MYTLVIVESPAKCKKIEEYLGPNYKVMASFGHIQTLNGLSSIDITNSFHPTYSIVTDELKQRQIEKLQTAIGNAEEVILATDDDREGESIAWHLCDVFQLPVLHTKRIIFHEITQCAITHAIQHPKRINMELVQSQQARQILDLLVGYTISPILWTQMSNNTLSAGRCQTPALRLIYENDLEVKRRPGKLVYNTVGYFTAHNLPFELNTQLESPESVQEFLKDCQQWTFIYSITEPKKTIKQTPEPLTTSALQQLASNELHLSPKETMKYAQQLYEEGYITYMRTDSTKYSRTFINNAKEWIESNYGNPYISQTIDRRVQDETDIRAHEAIRPVNIDFQVLSTSVKSKATQLYTLIWRRTVESCMSSAQFQFVHAKLHAPNNLEFVYRAEQSIFLGWQIVSDNIHSRSEKESYYHYLRTLKSSSNLNPKWIESTATLIEMGMQYTEARLVQLLEEKGIGRPSTFASLVDKIQTRKYVVKQHIPGRQIECIDFLMKDGHIAQTTNAREFGSEKNKLVIQPMGIAVIDFLLSKFDSFFDYQYTKKMEDDLDRISKGTYVWHQMCDECYRELTAITNNNNITRESTPQKIGIRIDSEHTLIHGKYGPVIKRELPTVKNKGKVQFLPAKKDLDMNILQHKAHIDLTDVIDSTNIHKSIGKYKGKDLYIKTGKYGTYAQWGDERRALKGIESTEYIDVLRYLDKDVLDVDKPIGIVRELTDQISIRTGKYGDYIFYKKPRTKKPQFLKLSGFNADYTKCDKTQLLHWIQETYHINT